VVINIINGIGSPLVLVPPSLFPEEQTLWACEHGMCWMYTKYCWGKDFGLKGFTCVY